MGELARRFAVEFHDLAAQFAQQARHDDAAHRVDRVDHHLEAALAHGLDIHKGQRQHPADVFVVEILTRNDMADSVDGRVVEIALFRHGQQFLALGIGEEFAVRIEQFQRVPLARIVRRRDDDAAVGLLRYDGHLGAGRGAEPHIDHIGAAGQEGSLHQIGHQFARNAGVAAHDYGKFFARIASGHQPGISRGELHDVGRGQILALGSSDGSANTRNGFDKRHIPTCLSIPISKRNFCSEVLLFDVNILLLCQL